ncbi:hypothetical protein AGMMS49921_05150 [Endomicrobiia bacterium]|nr:hypothetical protein AGMMS49921_05150 [Endomicrobiia bacterium]
MKMKTKAMLSAIVLFGLMLSSAEAQATISQEQKEDVDEDVDGEPAVKQQVDETVAKEKEEPKQKPVSKPVRESTSVPEPESKSDQYKDPVEETAADSVASISAPAQTSDAGIKPQAAPPIKRHRCQKQYQ